MDSWTELKKWKVFNEQLNKILLKRKKYQIKRRESTCTKLWLDRIERVNQEF